ncbi:hypothetical protein ACN265_02300 [Micromonospora sp. WMMD730]|uniref:hypothetical protein n=1 Tax=Micromonospora sp. WMMD730 TaxID=3404128 RepID=UPI003B94A3B1
MAQEAAMSPSSRQQPFRGLSNWKTATIALVMLILGILLLYVGDDETSFWEQHKGLQALCNNLGGLMIASLGLGVLWELMGKRSFAAEILEQARTSSDVHTAGLTQVGTNYLSDPDWEDLFSGTTKVDVFLACGTTWRNAHHQLLQRFAQKSGNRLRVFLPDPADTTSIKALAERFNKSVQELKDAIKEAEGAFKAIGKSGSANVTVYHCPGDRMFSFYRFDKRAVITLYSHSKMRGPVPTLVCRDPGSLYEFVRDEFRSIEESSKEA